MKIVTTFIYPPIPDRRFDWQAVTDDYEPGDPMGHGATEAEAKADLWRTLKDTPDPHCRWCSGTGERGSGASCNCSLADDLEDDDEH